MVKTRDVIEASCLQSGGQADIYDANRDFASRKISSNRVKKTQGQRQITVHLFYMNVTGCVIADTVFGFPVTLPNLSDLIMINIFLCLTLQLWKEAKKKKTYETHLFGKKKKNLRHQLLMAN